MGTPAHECQCAAAMLCRPPPPAEYPVRYPAAPHVSTSCQHQRLCMPFVRPLALHQLDRPQPTATALTLAEGSMRWMRDNHGQQLGEEIAHSPGLRTAGRTDCGWQGTRKNVASQSCVSGMRVCLAVHQRSTEQHHPFRPAVPQPCLHIRTCRPGLPCLALSFQQAAHCFICSPT